MTRSYKAVYVFFCVLIGAAVWMIAYGLILQFLFKDGRILHLTVTSNPFAPFLQFWYYAGNRNLQIAAAAALLPAAMFAVMAGLFGLRTPSNPLGDAAFQDTASLRYGKWLGKDGIIVGRWGRHVLRRKDDRHHLIIGPTRSGKGVGYVIPNALTWEGSIVVTDLKGEIYQHTAAYRKQAGNEVFLFSPGSANTHRWNPLDFVRDDRGSRTIDIQNIASILIPETIGSDNAVWQGTAQQVIAGVISYVLESQYYRNRRTLGEVNAIFNAGIDLQVLMKLIQEKEPELSRFTRDSFNAYISLNERAARSALLDIHKAMQPFRNERVTAATNVTEIDLASMRRKPVSIYLAPNITDVTILRPLLTLFVQQIMDLLTRQHDPSASPCYFLLDEFRQLKRMDEIMNKLPYVAGYNIKMAFIIQDLKNLDEIYGETARHSLLGNCGLQLILGANDQATAEYASRALGKKTIRYKSESRTLELIGLPRRTKVEQIRERDLMMPQEVRQMSESHLIVLVESQRPILARKMKYFDTASLKNAAQFSIDNVPDIPEAEFLLQLPVPAVVKDYATNTSEVVVAHEPFQNVPSPQSVPVAPNLVSKTIRQRKVTKAIVADSSKASPAKRRRKHGEKSVEAIEVGIKETAAKLKAVTTKTADDKALPNSRRRSIQDILERTVPDPVDIGVEFS